MSGDPLFKIKLKNGRVLGPIDLARVRALIRTGDIVGTEQACRHPNEHWRTFSSFPELGEAFLAAMSGPEPEAKPAKKKPSEPASGDPSATGMTIPVQETNPSFQHAEKPQKKAPTPARNPQEENPYGEVPTLINIKHDVDPDLERTRITQASAPGHRETIQQYVEGATKVIDARRGLPLQPEKGERVPIAKALGLKIEKRLLSKNVVYILVACLMISFYMMKQETAVKDEVNDLKPKTFRFKPVQVNAPTPAKDKKINVALSLSLLDQAIPYYDLDSPVGYIKAAGYLYKSVFHNPDNIVARSLLASSYIRLAEVIPRNERFYETIKSLLMLDGQKKPGSKPAEYYLAVSEFDLLLERPERALQTIEAAAKRSPIPMLLYQQALLYRLQGERNKAIFTLNRALKMSGAEDRNPRHLLLYAQLLEEKDQRDIALKVIRNFLKRNPTHGQGLYTYAKILYKNNDMARAIKTMILLINNPQRSDPATLANSFLLTARIFEARKRHDKALQFAKAAKFMLAENAEADELIFRIQARSPGSQAIYKYLDEAKEKEKMLGKISSVRDEDDDRAKRVAEVTNLYVLAREADRSSPLPLFHLAKFYERIGKPQLAVELYKKITQMERKIDDAYFALANLYLRQYEIDSAIAMMRAIRGKMKKSSRVTHMLGRIALARNDKAQARAQFLAAIEAGSRIPQLYVDMAELETERKEVDLAEFYFSVALRYDPYNEDALYGIALSRFYKTTPTDAIKFLESKLFARPNSPQVLTNLALIHLRSGNKDLGKKYLQLAVRNDPTYARAYKLMGNLVREEGDRQSDFEEKRRSYKFALASYGAYSKLAPYDPEGFMLAADLYRNVRDLGAAAKNYHKVMSLAPNYPMVRVHLAKIALNGQDGDGAMKLIQEEIKRHPNSSEAYYELGRIHVFRKEFALASQAFTNSAKLDPKNSEAIVKLGYVHYLQGDFASAVALFERALEIAPLNSEIHWKIGLAYEKDGKKMKALAAFRNCQGLSTDPAVLEKVRAKILKLQAGQ